MLPVEAGEGVAGGWLGAEGGAAVGDVVVLAVALDVDDGCDPLAVEFAAGRACAEGLGDVGGWVVDDAGDLDVETAVENAVDLGEFDGVGGVGGEVAGASVLAGFNAGDLLVEAFDASFTSSRWWCACTSSWSG